MRGFVQALIASRWVWCQHYSMAFRAMNTSVRRCMHRGASLVQFCLGLRYTTRLWYDAASYKGSLHLEKNVWNAANNRAR